MINKCIFLGEVARKQASVTKTGKSMLRFTVRTWDAEQNSEFLECVAYGKQADLIDRDFPIKRNIFVETKAHSYKNSNGELQVQFILIEFKYLTKEVKNEKSEFEQST